MEKMCEISFILLFLITSISYSQKLNGHDWENYNHEEKIAFLQGFLVGEESGFQSLSAVIKNEDYKKIEDFKSTFYSRAMGISLNQISDGLDSVYKDYRNKQF